MGTPNRGYTELNGNSTPDVPYEVNRAIREIDADVESVDNKAKAAGAASTANGARIDAVKASDTAQNGRLSLLESAAGFDAPPLGFEDAVVGALVADPSTDTAGQIAQSIDAAVLPYTAGAAAQRPADKTALIGWGSSTLAYLAGPLADVASRLGIDYHNGAHGGEKAEHILARMGARPAELVFPAGTLPASGAVTVTAHNMYPSPNLEPYAGTIAGVHGTLSSTADALTWTRTTAGTAFNIPAGVGFVPDYGTAHRDTFALLNIGKNDVTGLLSDAGYIIKSTREAMAYLAGAGVHFLTIGHFINTNYLPGTYAQATINAANIAAAADAGPYFFDLQAYVTGPDIWTDTGITPTATDLQQQADGVKPTSLSRDDAHLSAAADAAVAARIEEQLDALGLFPRTGFIDTFSRADATGDIGVTEAGRRSWQIEGAGTEGHLLIENGQLGIGGLTGNRAVGYVDANYSDGVFSFDQSAIDAGPNFWAVLRMQNVDNLLYLAPVSTTDRRWALWRRQGAADTAVTIGTAASTVAAGDHLDVTLAGADIAVTINGAEEISVNEQALQAQTRFGVCVWGSNNQLARWDNLQLVP